MNEYLEKLISISSGPICQSAPSLLLDSHQVKSNDNFEDLGNLLKLKNGFYSFESALHVFPSSSKSSVVTIENWNEPNLWKASYEYDFDEIYFFAEDLFGGQFGIQQEQIIKFEPESCEVSIFAGNLGGWALKILEDYEYETGYPLAVEWRKRNGPIPAGKRLLPKVPFILGGAYEATNLYSIDAVEGMRFRADLCNQIKDLPDGTNIEIEITE